MRKLLSMLALVALIACGGSTSTITAQQVYERLQKSGLAVNGRTVPAPAAGAIFEGCTDQYGFDVAGAPGTLAVAFVCPKSVADGIMAKPKATPIADGAMKGLDLAPHIYRSAGGTVLVSLAATAPPALASRIGSEVALIPE